MVEKWGSKSIIWPCWRWIKTIIIKITQGSRDSFTDNRKLFPVWPWNVTLADCFSVSVTDAPPNYILCWVNFFKQVIFSGQWVRASGTESLWPACSVSFSPANSCPSRPVPPQLTSRAAGPRSGCSPAPQGEGMHISLSTSGPSVQTYFQISNNTRRTGIRARP